MLPLLDIAERRDRAIAQVAQHAEDYRPGFGEQARAAVLAHLEAHGPTSGEQLVDACLALGLRPHDQRAYGSVFQVLIRRGAIQKIADCKRKKGHLTSGGAVYARCEVTQ